MNILQLPESILALFFTVLDSATLCDIELTCKRFRDTVRKEKVWFRKCQNTKELPDMPPLVIDHEGEITSGYVRHPLLEAASARFHTQTDSERIETKRINKLSLHYKRIKCLVDRREGSSNMLHFALVASSTDQPEEELDNVLDPECGPEAPNQPCYWSSQGSEDEGSIESVTFSLHRHVCIVTAIQIRPFKAWFQHGSPIYAPKAVRIYIGGVNCLGAEHCEPDHHEETSGLSWDVLGSTVQDFAEGHLSSHSAASIEKELDVNNRLLGSYRKFEAFRGLKEWRWISPKVYPIAKEDTLQTIEIPPTLCVGGYIRLDLIGRTQRQEVDGLYYTCLGHVTCLGKPLHRFIYGAVNPVDDGDGDGDLECKGDVYCRYWSDKYYAEDKDPIG